MSAVKNIYVLTLVMLSSGLACSSNAGFDSGLREELLAMAEVDDELRSQVLDAESADMEQLRELQESEVEQTAQLKEILEAHGWPGVKMVGHDGAAAAWTLLKHADIDTKQRALELIEESDDAGVPATEIAFMTDEVLVAFGKPQLYGTQFAMAHGSLVQQPVDDRDSVDARRARIGLPPLEEYLEMLQGAHGMSAQGDNPHAGMPVVPTDSASSNP